MVAVTLYDFGVHVNFSFYPVPHLNSSNDIICEINDDGEIYKFDCEGRVYEQCIMAEACWDVPGGCGQATQLSIANFLKCWEGPDANQEASGDFDELPGCLQEAGLSSPEQCVSDAPRVANLSEKMRLAKIPMMASLGPDPGSFPHIFVNGEHQGNYSFVALTRTLCETLSQLGIVTDEPCTWEQHALTFDIQGNLSVSIIANKTWWNGAVQDAADVATSAEALPIGFDLADPKYVNVRATKGAEVSYSLSQGKTSFRVSVQVLHAFAASFHGMSGERFAAELAANCTSSGVNVSAANVSSVAVEADAARAASV